MRYQLRRGKSVSSEVRRIAKDELQQAVEDLVHQRPDLHTAIHEFRKRCKRLRALLRIVRPNLKHDFRSGNNILRDLSRELSHVRDAQALLEALDRLEDASEGLGAFPRTRELLLERRESAAGGESALRRKLEKLVPIVTNLRGSVDDWRIKGQGFECLAGGLAKTYARARAGRKRCLKKGSTHNFHEWRKRVKYHWHHTLLLTNSCPSFMHPHRLLAEQLGELLGHDHDYAVLAERLHEFKMDDAFHEEKELVLRQIRRQQKQVRRKALHQGGYLLVEKPEALVARWSGYFDEWNAEA